MKRVLVIEDEPEMRRNLILILKLENFEPTGAEDGLKGVEAARQSRPDLILCDLMMPGLDGFGVLESLRKNPVTAGIPFIFLTARGEMSDLRAGMNLGADDYLVKPVEAEELITAIRARLERQESLNQGRKSGGSGSLQIDYSSSSPLETLGLTPRQSEILLWVAQGKTNPEIAIILGLRLRTIKKHMEHIFKKIGVESRHAAIVRAMEVLPSGSQEKR